MSTKLPIFHDDLSFGDRHRRSLDDLMKRDFGGDLGSHRWGTDFDDDFRRMYDDFFQLKPRAPTLDRVRATDPRGLGSSTESLDDKTVENLLVNDPETGGRKFQISFAVKDYDPNDIAVKIDGSTLLVEAKHETVKDGMKSTKEFNRKFEIPKEVDPEKLVSRLSNDGVLTIEAPVPPTYKSLPGGGMRSSPLSPHIRNGSSPLGSPSAFQPHPLSHTHQQYQPQPAPASYSTYPHSQQHQHQAPVASHTPYSPQQSYPEPPSYASQPRPVNPPVYPQSAPIIPQHHQQQQHQPAYPGTSSTQHTPSQYSAPRPSPPQFDSVAQKTPAASSAPVGVPTYYTDGEGKKMELYVELGKEFGPDDLMVKVDGSRLIVEAMRELTIGNRKSKSSVSKEFEMDDDVNSQTINANFMPDGKLKITAKAS